MAIFPGAVSTDADLYIAVNNLSTLLTDNPLTVGATTVNVLSTTGFPTVGAISIDAEIIKYTGKTATSFTGCTRGFDGTTAASHLLNAQVDHNVIAVHHNAHKDEIIATEQFISDIIGRVATQVRAPDGTLALPGISLASQTDMGFYKNSATRLSVGVATVNVFDFQSTENDSRVDFFVERNQASATVGLFVSQQDNSSATSHARVQVRVGGSSAGDPFTHYAITGLADAYVGLDNDDGDDLVVGFGTTVGAGKRAKFRSNGQTALYANNTLGLDLSENAGQVQVRTATTGSATAPALALSDTGNGFYRSAINEVSTATAGAQRMVVDASGRVGIGLFSSLSDIVSIFQSGSPTLRLQTNTTGNPSIRWINSVREWSDYVNASGNRIIRDNTGTVDVLEIRNTTNGVGLFFTNGGIIGQTAGANATTGHVGEYVLSVQGSNVTNPGTGQWFDITSISLTAGDWDVWMIGAVNTTDYAPITDIEFGIHTVAGNNSPGATQMGDFISMAFSTGHISHKINQTFHKRFNITSTTTMYAKCFITYSSGTHSGIAKIWARRMR